MIGAPVRRLARAHARWTFSTFGEECGLDVGPLDAALDVVREGGGHRVLGAALPEQRQVVVGVDAGAGNDLQTGLARDPRDEPDVASEQHRRRLADRLHSAVERSARGLDGGGVERVFVVEMRELLGV
jgi:hypothetical protein